MVASADNERKQNILIVHNYYQIPGGEDTVVANEKKMLEEHGHKVVLYSRNNSELKEMSKRQKVTLMVGTGELKNAVEERIKDHNLSAYVQMIERIPNSEIWELYCMADVFVNLNQKEIFGMAILEAMYYGCKVVAWKAPGPNLIIENGISGWLAESNQAVIEAVQCVSGISEAAHKRIIDNFTWESSAKKILPIIGE